MNSGITERVLELLKEQGKKQSDLCKYAGIAHSTFTNWKTRGTDPKPEHLQKIAEFLGVTVHYLLNGEGATFVDPDIVFKGDGNTYYLDHETAQIAQEMYNRPELRGLFDASRELSSEDIKAVKAMVDHLWHIQHPDD